MGLAEVASILWRERETLELLLFKLEEEQLILAAGRTRWLVHATKEVELILDRIKETELLRASEVDAVAAEYGLSSSPSLAALADGVGQPWADLLREHRRAFLALTADITTVAEVNRDLLTTGQRASRETLITVTGSLQTYGRDGGTTAAAPTVRLLDEAM
jgi:FlgN protein